MLPTNDQHKNTKTTPPTRATTNNYNPSSDGRALSLTPCFVFFNLTICSLTTMYRAYEHNDYPVVAFVLFVYAAYFAVDECLAVYNRLPRGEQSVRKEVLRFTLWGLPSGILLGFAYQFGTFMNTAVVVLMYIVAIASSLLLFYVHYILDRDQNGCGFCSTLPHHSSCPDYQKNNSDNV